MCLRHLEIAIPVLNEERTLAKQIDVLDKFLSTGPIDGWQFSIVIADNGSVDRTLETARGLSTQTSLRTLHIPVRGVGGALKAAWTSSDAPWVGFMDLDLATDLRHLRSVCLLLEEGEPVVVGSRRLPESSVINRRRSRALLSWGLNSIVNKYLRCPTSDVMCGFKFLRREVYEHMIMNGFDSDGWFFSAQIPIMSYFAGYAAREIAVDWTDDLDSKVQVSTLVPEFIREIYETRQKLLLAR